MVTVETVFAFADVQDANVFASWAETCAWAGVERVDDRRVRLQAERIDHYGIRKTAEYYGGRIESSTVDGLPAA